jgi:hypothetical protein
MFKVTLFVVYAWLLVGDNTFITGGFLSGVSGRKVAHTGFALASAAACTPQNSSIKIIVKAWAGLCIKHQIKELPVVRFKIFVVCKKCSHVF